jgi:hypothetical protein
LKLTPPRAISVSISAAVAPSGAEACRIAARDREVNRDGSPFIVVEAPAGQEEGTRSWDDISYTGHKAKTGIFSQIMTRATFRPEQNRPDELGRPPGPKKLVFKPHILIPKVVGFTLSTYTRAGAEANKRRTLTS